jgi:mannose-6-phosphate isomerase-like protein (cupin superfamily)
MIFAGETKPPAPTLATRLNHEADQMSQGTVIVRGPGEGRTLLVGGGDYVTMKASGGEAGGQFCLFEISTTPGFGPPLHVHHWAEFFYVLDGEYEFQRIADGELETIVAGPGTSVVLPAWVPHTFRNPTGTMSRMLIMHSPAALEAFFEALGEPVEKVGDLPSGDSVPDVSKMVEELARAGVYVVPSPSIKGSA